MQEFKYFTKTLFALLVLFIMITSCRKKIDFDKESKFETSPFGPYQQYYEPWQSVNASLTGTPTLINTDNSFLYIASESSGRSYMRYMNSNLVSYPLFYSNNYKFTAIEKGNTKMIIGASGGQYSLREFDENGIYATFNFYVTPDRKINDISTDGLKIYPVGNFVGTNLNPSSFSVDKHNKVTNTSEGMPGIAGEVLDIEKHLGEFYIAGNEILNFQHSIAKWNGSQWQPFANIDDDKVTGISWIGDTLFIAGYANGQTAIRKYANGSLIEDNIVVNTASSEEETDIKLYEYGTSLYAYGTINFPGSPYTSVLEYQNGQWNYVGNLGGVAKDIVAFGGYLYAIVGNSVKRIQL
ncbi:MAG: hypothetical protein ACFHU9_10755 [Fluviicola sp.]